jgi:hypothetical protein
MSETQEELNREGYAALSGQAQVGPFQPGDAAALARISKFITWAEGAGKILDRNIHDDIKVLRRLQERAREVEQ